MAYPAPRAFDQLGQGQAILARTKRAIRCSAAGPARSLTPICATSAAAVEELPVELQTPLEILPLLPSLATVL
eukprot:2988965-Pyramimonas_sp.AAC.1